MPDISMDLHDKKNFSEHKELIMLRINFDLTKLTNLNQIIEKFAKEVRNLLDIKILIYKNNYLAITNRKMFFIEDFSKLCIKLTKDGENYGQLYFITRHPVQYEQTLQLLYLCNALINPINYALKLKKAIDESLSDPLTKIGNRAAMNIKIDQEINDAHRYNYTFSMVMVDIDNFKLINDEYGHIAGDKVLKQVIENIRVTLRNNDHMYRYGGDEFIIIMPHTDKFGADRMADRIREIHTNNIMRIGEHNIKVSLSTGASEYREKDCVQKIINRADNELYNSKFNIKRNATRPIRF